MFDSFNNRGIFTRGFGHLLAGPLLRQPKGNFAKY